MSDNPHQAAALLVIREGRIEDADAIHAALLGIAETVGETHKMTSTVDDIRRHGFGPHPAFLTLVAEQDGVIAGYAYATPWKARHAYRHSVEITVYLRQNSLARGLGTALYSALFDALQKRPIHAVVACIALPNAHSVALHEKFGMRKVAHFAEVGYKLGAWRDVGYWQVNLDKDVY